MKVRSVWSVVFDNWGTNNRGMVLHDRSVVLHDRRDSFEYGRGNLLDDDWMGSWFAMDDGVETVNGVGAVLDGALSTVWFDQGVHSSDHIAVSGLLLGLDIAGSGVIYCVLEVVMGWGFWLDCFDHRNDLGDDGSDDFRHNRSRSVVGVRQRSGMYLEPTTSVPEKNPKKTKILLTAGAA